MTKLWNFNVAFHLHSLSIIQIWMIRAIGIIRDVAMEEQIYNQEIVFEMAIFSQIARVHKNSI